MYMSSIKSVPPLGESMDDWAILANVLSRAIRERATARGIGTGQRLRLRSAGRMGLYAARRMIFYDALQLPDGTTKKIERSTADAVDFIIQNSAGVPNVPFDELSAKGFIRVDDSAGTCSSVKIRITVITS